MRRVVAVLGVVVLCASVVMSAEGGGISPVPTGPLEVIRPDLVVKQVEVSRGVPWSSPHTHSELQSPM